MDTAFVMLLLSVLVILVLPITLAVALTNFNRHLRRLRETTALLVATVQRMERADGVVATNLASSISRADATNGPEGAAADAALRTGDKP